MGFQEMLYSVAEQEGIGPHLFHLVAWDDLTWLLLN